MLSEQEKHVLHEAIVNGIRDIRDDIASLEEAVQPISPDNAIGRVSRMDAISSKSVNEELLRQAKQRLGQLEQALQRIDGADYGVCTRCGIVIPVGRLLAMPESTRCTAYIR